MSPPLPPGCDSNEPRRAPFPASFSAMPGPIPLELPVISTFFPWNDIGTSRLPRRILVLPFAILNASPWVFPPLTPPTVNIGKGRIRMKFDFRLDFSFFVSFYCQLGHFSGIL